MASTRTTPTSPRTVRSIPKGIDLNKQLSSHDLTNLEVTDLTIGGEIVLGAGTVGLTLSTTAATPAEVLRFSTLRAGADGDVQRISFRAWDSNNVLQEYAQINAQLNDVTAATLDSSFELACMVAGTMTTVFDSNVSSAGVITSTFPVGDAIITDGSLAVTDADNANSLIVTNNTATTSDVIQFIGSGVFTGTGADAFVNITQSGATSGEAASIIANGLTIGSGLLVSSTGVITTVGELVSLVGNSATTSTGLLRVSGTGLTDGFAGQFTGGGANTTATGGVLDINAGLATLGSALRVGTTGVYTGTTGVVAINAAAATTGDIVVIDATGLTEGSALRINTTTATLTTGFYIECNDGAASDFTVGDFGATVIAGTAAGTDALTLTTGDVQISSGDIDVSLGHIFVTENGVGLSALELARTEDAASVQVAMLEGNRATPTDGDTAFVALRLSDSAGTQREGARISWRGTTVLAGATGDTDLVLSYLANNVLTEALVLDGSAAQIVMNAATVFATATNQLVLGVAGGNQTTISSGAPAAARAYTIADAGVDTSFAMLGSAQTFDGAKTFTALTTHTVAGNTLRATNTTDAASVQVGILEGNRATPTDNDAAYVSMQLSDSAGNQDESARITWQATTVLNGATQDSDLLIAATVNNALTTMLTLDGSASQVVFNVGSTFAGTTIADLGTVTTANIDGGTLDGVSIGATTPAAAIVSTLSVTGTDIILDSDIANTGTLRFTTGAAAAVITLPNATGTLYSTVASSISSAQLLSSMSDETGTGLLVFATAPAIVGGSHIELTGLSIRSTGAAFDQLFATATVFTADRTLNFAIGDADRTLTMTGDATLNQDVSTTANPTFGNLTITSFAANWTNAGRTVADAGILTTVDINGGSIDGATIGAAAAGAATFTTCDATTDFTIGSLVVTSNTLTATGRLTTAMTVPTVGTGFDGALVALWVPYGRKGAAGPVVTEFIVDLTNLVSSATDADIIGETDAANANLGQITAAIHGTSVLIEMVCLETPAGGSTDLNLYSATEATGTEDTLVTDLTETLLLDRGAAWANGDVRGATVMPAANEYLYLANGAAGTDAAYTAGKFKITIYGTV